MKKLLVIMDPLEHINPKKDTSLAFMLEAQNQGLEVFYAQAKDLYVLNGQAHVYAQAVTLYDDLKSWFDVKKELHTELKTFAYICMRVDPPFNMEYIYTTYILDMAKAQGVQVLNDPQSLRDCNEKMFIQWFPQLIAPTMVSKNKQALQNFLNEQQKVVIKPMDGMGGEGIFILDIHDPNCKALLQSGTRNFTQTVMLQKYLPEIAQGDKRIFIVHGQVIPFTLVRTAAEGQARANLASGGKGVPRELTAKELKICDSIAQELQKRGLLFVGLDMIGDTITEINVTSPTGIKEIEEVYPDAQIVKKFVQKLF